MSFVVKNPFLFSFSRVFVPIPQTFFSGMESMKFSSCPMGIAKKPLGLFTSLASLARYALDAKPIETVSFVSLKISFCILSASASGSPKSSSVPVRSRLASSIET